MKTEGLVKKVRENMTSEKNKSEYKHKTKGIMNLIGQIIEIALLFLFYII